MARASTQPVIFLCPVVDTPHSGTVPLCHIIKDFSNKIPHTGWAMGTKNFFLTVLVAEKAKITV